jgi:hypothetical protein
MRLLSTAAAIVLLSGGMAMAQGLAPGAGDNPGRAPAAQQNAPAEKMGPSIKRKAPETTGQAVPERQPGAAGPQNKMNTEKTQKKVPETTGQGSQDQGNVKERRGASEMQKKGGANAEGTVQQRDQRSQRGERGEHNDQMGAGAKGDNQHSTTGQGAAGAARLSTEQRTKITGIFHQHRVAPTHLNISIRVGARVPASVHFYPVPVEVVEIYPEWRGFDYILVGDQILILDPGTHEIVAILEA